MENPVSTNLWLVIVFYRKRCDMGIRFGFVSTYPPTRCGIATFSSSLMTAIRGLDSHTTSVVRLMDSPTGEVSRAGASEIISTVTAGDSGSIIRATKALNSMDVALIQHEFGIYGGPDGEEVLTLLKGLHVPSIVVLHTVLTTPSQHQRMVFTKMCDQASAVVTMSKSAQDRLVAGYSIDPSKVFIMPHGAPAFPVIESKAPSSRSPLILTWGLIGPGKGIEWAIESMDRLRDLDPAPRYVVAGRTHPKVFEREGESYREGLQRRIDELGLADSVQLQGDYLSDKALTELVASASVVLLPYDSVEQVTSGVLIEAVTAGRPVVATRFPHAVELLADNVGIVVPHRDPDALANAVRQILQHPELADEMSRQASVLASQLLWPSVAARYVRLARAVIRAAVAA